MIAVAVVLAALIVGAAYFARERSADALLRSRRLHKVLVELHSGETFEGVLVSCDSRTIVLHNARALMPNEAAPLGVDGELLLPRVDLKFVQRP